MAARPTSVDLIAWLGLGTQLSDQDTTALNDAIATAVDVVESRVSFTDEYPTAVRLAVLITGARYYQRRFTPGGTISNDFGVIRVNGIDQDVENLIDLFLTLTGFF